MDYSVYQEYNPEVSKNTNSEKNEFSFYECPTAAASIQEFGDYSKSNSLDSDQDYSIYDASKMSISLSTDEEVSAATLLNDAKVNGGTSTNKAYANNTEGGSVSFTKKVITGGYYGGSDGVVYSGTPQLTKVPKTLLGGYTINGPSGVSYGHAGTSGVTASVSGVAVNWPVGGTTFGSPLSKSPGVGVEASGIRMETVKAPVFAGGVPASSGVTTVPTVHTPKSARTVHTLDLNGHNSGYTEAVDGYTGANVESYNAVASEPLLFAPNAYNPTVLPPSAYTVPLETRPVAQNGGTGWDSGVENRQPIITSPSVKDYSRAVECKSTSETTFVQEGYDTICVPRYRPVEIVEKRIEVPVVHHVDTFVPKKEIQEIENIVKKPYTKVVDKIVEVPQIHYTDKIVEVPEYHEVVKSVPKIQVQERTKYVPKVQVKVVPKYVEVPVVKFVDSYKEVEEVEEVVKHVEKVEVVEVPREVVKHVVKPVKRIIEQERIVPVIEHRDVPVEKVKFVPKIETVELLRQVPKVIDVPVPYNVPKVEYVDQPYIVPKYRDVPVAVPVMKRVHPIVKQENVEYVDVPIHRPYFVIHDHLNFKDYSKDNEDNLRVVNVNQVNLETVDEAFRQECQAVLNQAINTDAFSLYRQGNAQNPQDGQTFGQPEEGVNVPGNGYVGTQGNVHVYRQGSVYKDVYPQSAAATPRN